jgi:hypothetical protein
MPTLTHAASVLFLEVILPMSNIIRGVKIFRRRLWNNGLIEFYFNFENGIPTKDRHKEHGVYSLWLWLWLWLWEKIDGIHSVPVRLPGLRKAGIVKLDKKMSK